MHPCVELIMDPNGFHRGPPGRPNPPETFAGGVEVYSMAELLLPTIAYGNALSEDGQLLEDTVRWMCSLPEQAHVYELRRQSTLFEIEVVPSDAPRIHGRDRSLHPPRSEMRFFGLPSVPGKQPLLTGLTLVGTRSPHPAPSERRSKVQTACQPYSPPDHQDLPLSGGQSPLRAHRGRRQLTLKPGRILLCDEQPRLEGVAAFPSLGPAQAVQVAVEL